MNFVECNHPPGTRTLRLHMDAAARQGERSLPALILRLAEDHRLLDVMTFIQPLDDDRRDDGSEVPQALTIEIRDEEIRLRSFAASLANLHGIILATLDETEILFSGGMNE